jgi:uncharacterized protein
VLSVAVAAARGQMGNRDTAPLVRIASKGKAPEVDAVLTSMPEHVRAEAAPLALYAAIRKGRTDVVSLLLDRGYRPPTWLPDELSLAADAGQVAVVKLLLDRGWEVDRAPKGEMTALMLGARRGDADVVLILLQAGAKVGRRTRSGDTALSIARRRRHTDVIAVLEKVQPPP